MTRRLLIAAIALLLPFSAAADSKLAPRSDGRLEKAVLFDYGKTRVRSTGRSTLAAVARMWRAVPVPMKITVEGHGYALEEEASIELGYRRALRVRERLIAEGVDPRFIEAVGHSRAEIGRYVDLVFSTPPGRTR